MTCSIQVKPRFVKGRPWCTQEQIRPIPRSVLTYKCSERIKELAQPKPEFYSEHSLVEDYTLDYELAPFIRTVSSAALKAKCSDRVRRLAEPKAVPQERYDVYYAPRRSSRSVSKSAAQDKHRLQELAKPRRCHPDYRPQRRLPVRVRRSALKCTPSMRIERLAEPRMRLGLQSRKEEVSKSALEYVATEHIRQLSKSRERHPLYQPPRILPCPVSRSALHAKTSERLNALAKPVVRKKMEDIQINMGVFKVKETALTAKCTKRLKKLAEPVERP